MVRVLLFGGGVQTTAMLLEYPARYDYVIFADVSAGTKFDEKSDTYIYLDKYIKPYLKSKNIPLIIVQSTLGSLYDYCIEHNIIPLRNLRWCTDKWKRIPIQKWIKKNLQPSKEKPVYQDMGFSWDEYWRAGRIKQTDKMIFECPLVDHKITRQDCKDIILKHFPELPPKSGCVYCPFAKKSDFKEIKRKEPEKWNKILELEQNHTKYPNVVLKTKPLVDWIQDNEILDDYMECDDGYCFV